MDNSLFNNKSSNTSKRESILFDNAIRYLNRTTKKKKLHNRHLLKELKYIRNILVLRDKCWWQESESSKLATQEEKIIEIRVRLLSISNRNFNFIIPILLDWIKN